MFLYSCIHGSMQIAKKINVSVFVHSWLFFLLYLPSMAQIFGTCVNSNPLHVASIFDLSL